MHLLCQAADPFYAGEIAGMLPNGIQQAAFPGIPLIVLLRGEVMGVHSRGDDKAVVFSVGDKQLPLSFSSLYGGAKLFGCRPDLILQPGRIAGDGN